MSTDQTRQPAGAPTGGQFTTGTRTEGGVTLNAHPAHHHEQSMLDEHPDGGMYCKACGERVGPDGAEARAAELEAAASEAVARLIATDPERALRLWERMQTDLTFAEYPQLLVGTDEQGHPRFLDPYTDEPTLLVMEDTSFRHTKADPLHPDEQTVRFEFDDATDYESFVYRSSATNRPVSLPDDWDDIS